MINGVGIDLIEISRIERLLGNRFFMERVFTPAERAYIESRKAFKSASAAGIFCAKEAVSKAFGTGIRFPLRDVEVLREPSGRPYIVLFGKAEHCGNGARVHLSITHTRTSAAAFAVLEAQVKDDR